MSFTMILMVLSIAALILMERLFTTGRKKAGFTVLVSVLAVYALLAVLWIRSPM